MTRGTCLVGAAAFAVCAVFSVGTLRAVDVSVFPNSGGIGQEFDLRSFGFTPVKKPRVRLVPHPDQPATKSVWVEVDLVEADRIAVTLRKGAAGVYDVVVVPKDRGVEDVTLPQPFTILLPVVDGTDPPSGAGGTEVTIHGSLFGPSKGKVTIGGKKAKVTSWSDDTIVVVVSKKAPVGDQPVVVVNKAGASTTALTFSVAESAPGGGGGGGGGGGDGTAQYLRADLSGRPRLDVTDADPLAINVFWEQFGGQVMFGGTPDTTTSYPALTINIGGLDPGRATPYSIGLLPDQSSLASASMNYVEDGTVIYLAQFGFEGVSLTVTVTGWDGTFFTGTFSGTLVDPGGVAAPITVTNGQFRVRSTNAP